MVLYRRSAAMALLACPSEPLHQCGGVILIRRLRQVHRPSTRNAL